MVKRPKLSPVGLTSFFKQQALEGETADSVSNTRKAEAATVHKDADAGNTSAEMHSEGPEDVKKYPHTIVQKAESKTVAGSTKSRVGEDSSQVKKAKNHFTDNDEAIGAMRVFDGTTTLPGIKDRTVTTSHWPRRSDDELNLKAKLSANEGVTAVQLATPDFNPEQVPPEEIQWGQFSLFAQALEAIEAAPLAIVALSNYFRLLLHGYENPLEVLCTSFRLLVPASVIPASVLSIALAEAFGVKDIATEDLAAVAFNARRQQRTLKPLPRLSLLDIESAIVAAIADLKAGDKEADEAVGKRLARFICSFRAKDRETFFLLRVLQGRPGQPRNMLLRSIAHAFVLSCPPSLKNNQPAKLQQFATPEARHATLLAMDTAARLAFGECNNVERFFSALLDGKRPAELYGACGPSCGVPLLFMNSMSTNDINIVLSRMTGHTLTVEQCYVGERVQVHKSEGVLSMYGKENKNIVSILDEDLTAAISGALRGPTQCILDAVLQRSVDGGAERLTVFDCLWLDGCCLTRRAQRFRRTALRKAIPLVRERDEVVVAPFEEFTLEAPPTVEELRLLMSEALDGGSRGLVLKRSEGEYEAGINSSSWLALLPAPSLD